MSSQKHIHFIGICGVAMSALALAFKRQGYIVTGSDVGFYPPISTHLKDNHVDYYPGWHPEKVLASFKEGIKKNPKDYVVVVGNVASSQNPEWMFTLENKLPYRSYPEIIRDFFIKKNSIVVAGTYGKSTSTTLLAWILKEADYNPSYMFGGLSHNTLPAAELTSSDWSVVEGDEYKASRWDKGPKFNYYKPTHLLLTSIVWDHADIYPKEKSYLAVFKKLAFSIPKKGLRVISEQTADVLLTNRGIFSSFSNLLGGTSPIVVYGKGEQANYRYTNIVQTKNGLTFDIIHDGTTYHLTSPCLGDYMADNITGCFAMAKEIGLAPEAIIKAVSNFTGMKRRLEKRHDGAVVIFDDIAHSGTKAKSVLETLKAVYPDSKRIAVFEPNTGNRRPESVTWYEHAFDSADEVIIPRLTKIKNDPREAPPFEGDALADIIRKTQPNVSYIDNDEALVERLASSPAKTVIVFLGSHGFRGMIEEVIKKVTK